MNDTAKMTPPVQFTLKQLLGGMAAVCVVIGVSLVMGLLPASLLAFGLSLWMVALTARRRNQTHASASIGLAIASGVVFFLALGAWGVLGIGPIYLAESYPHGLQQMISTAEVSTWGTKASCVSRTIDSQYVWRIRLSETQLNRVVESFELLSVESASAPAAFYRAFPRGWRPSHQENARFFATQGFSADERGADGLHYYAMYDPDSDRFYVWCKDNF